ncbi:unnamed protein product [Alternaria sp. RS040]
MASNLDSRNSFIGESHVPRAQPILTRAFIEADYTCMTSQQITYYLERIWEFSSIYAFAFPRPMEVAAGHRYWLPNGLLAEEWMMLFTFVPRLLDLAPPEVRTAMGDGVVRPPRGRKAQMLTLVIEHVRGVTHNRNVRLSEAAAYAQQHNITVPVHHQMNFQNLAFEDQLPSEVFLDTIRDDYRNKFNDQDP